jgi:hypothetical protein
MRIQFAPQQKNYPADKKVHTNLGEFLPGEGRLLSPDQEAEGLRLIANGDFIDPNTEEESREVVLNVERGCQSAGTEEVEE